MHGIGVEGSDPIRSLDTVDVYYSSHYARHLFRSLDGVARIIETIAEDSVREGYNIILEPMGDMDKSAKKKAKLLLDKVTAVVEDRLHELDISQVKQKGNKYSNLMSRGAGIYPIIKGISDKRDSIDMTKPLDYSMIEKLEQLNVVQDLSLIHISEPTRSPRDS